jgi:hypothetical protein
METFASLKTMNKHRHRFALLAAPLTAIVAVALALPAPVHAQSEASLNVDRLSVKIDDPTRPVRVRASLINGGITVKGYDGKEVIVEARPRGAGESERPAPNGMRRLNILRTGLSVDAEDNEVRIGVDSAARTIDLVITVPTHSSLKLHVINDGDIVVSDVDGEFDVDNINGAVTLRNISGSAVAHALNGRLLATFVRVHGDKPMAFSSLNGDIDLTFPASLKANLSIRSDRGDVYSDFDVQLQSSVAPQAVEDKSEKGGKYRVRIDRNVRGTINGGGPEIQITDMQGAVYLRKAGK